MRSVSNPEISLWHYKWYQRRPLIVQYGSGMNKAESSGYVTPEANEGGEWLLTHKP